MADIFAEVDEAMRRERLEKLWKKHGTLILGLIAALIIGTGARSGYDYWNTKVSIDQTDKLITLMDSPDFPENIKDSGPDLRPGLRGIALLSGAGALTDANKPEEALALYTRAANDKAIPDDLRHLAVIESVRMRSDKEGVNAEELLAELKPVIGNSGSPWRWHARLEAAALLANHTQNYAEAREYLKQIQEEPGLPETLTAKAKALDHIYATRQSQQSSQKTDNGSAS